MLLSHKQGIVAKSVTCAPRVDPSRRLLGSAKVVLEYVSVLDSREAVHVDASNHRSSECCRAAGSTRKKKGHVKSRIPAFTPESLARARDYPGFRQLSEA